MEIKIKDLKKLEFDSLFELTKCHKALIVESGREPFLLPIKKLNEKIIALEIEVPIADFLQVNHLYGKLDYLGFDAWLIFEVESKKIYIVVAHLDWQKDAAVWFSDETLAQNKYV